MVGPDAARGLLTDPYEPLLIAPRAGFGICVECFNTTIGFDRCYACARAPRSLDVVVPITYSVAHEPIHIALAAYKRRGDAMAERMQAEIAAVLSRFLECHEPCLAAATAVQRFEIVTTVPSGDRDRDRHHPLRRIVGELSPQTRDRFQRLLRRSCAVCRQRRVDPRRYEATRALAGEPVLLVDDTWTTGASARSAALALKRAGAGPVAAVVIGRHLNRGWHENDVRLRNLARPFDWASCVLCAGDADRASSESPDRRRAHDPSGALTR